MEGYCYLKVKVCDNDDYHQHQVDKVDWQQVFPFERQQLVDTQTGECPLKPDDDERQGECLEDKPYYAGDVVHDGVEAVPTGEVEGHPAAEEKEGGNTRHDEEVEILGEVEEAEVHTRILGVVTGGKLALGLGKVKRAAVSLGRACYKVDNEGDDCGNMARENEP